MAVREIKLFSNFCVSPKVVEIQGGLAAWISVGGATEGVAA
ncbi:hypothetical protein [Nostoc commune]|nr:hypothetical protein [Nostoc commune]